MNNGYTIEKRLFISLAVTLVILFSEIIGGIISNSLALLSDAGHVFTDAFALGLSLFASFIMKRPSDYRATYGYQRIGILAALINGTSLVVMAILIFMEAYKRFISPPQVESTVMLLIATTGLAGNLIMAVILGYGHRDINIKSAWLHIIGDTVSSVGVIVAGLLIRYKGWTFADPVASCLVGIMIIIGGGRVIKEALWIFLELSPVGFHAKEISDLLCKIPGVIYVHDVHVWSIGHGIPAFSAHVQVRDQMISEADAIRKKIELELLRLGIKHSVIQMESVHGGENGLYCKLDSNKDTGHRH